VREPEPADDRKARAVLRSKGIAGARLRFEPVDAAPHGITRQFSQTQTWLASPKAASSADSELSCDSLKVASRGRLMALSPLGGAYYTIQYKKFK
jgi:hypothetical protein